MPINRRKGSWVFITPFTGLTLKYGFKSRATDAVQTELGQQKMEAIGDAITGLLVYPNNMTPHTARKKSTTGSEGSYCSADKIAALIAAKYKIKFGSPPELRQPTGNNQLRSIKINGITYCWIRAADPLSDQLGQFGHSTTKPTNLNDVSFGADFPKPPTVQVVTTTGSVSSFCDPQKVDELLSSGGRLIFPGLYTKDHLLSKFGNG